MAFLSMMTIFSFEVILLTCQQKCLILWKSILFVMLGHVRIYIFADFQSQTCIFSFSNPHLHTTFKCRTQCLLASFDVLLFFFFFSWKRNWTINLYPCLWTSITFPLSHLFSSLKIPGLLSQFLYGSIHSCMVPKCDAIAVFNSNLSTIC